MKIYLHLIFFSTTFIIFDCTGNSSKQKTVAIEQSIEIIDSAEYPKDTVENCRDLFEMFDRRYVSAKTGLYYRDLPLGKILGKFPLNTNLTLIDSTKIYNKIKVGKKIVEGEWVGIRETKYIEDDESPYDTVYVFSGFLSSSYVKSDVKLYNATSYGVDMKDGSIRTAFVNLTESLSGYYFNKQEEVTENSILYEIHIPKDTLKLDIYQRTKFLTELNISESDKVFIYKMRTDSIIEFEIKNLPVIAVIDVYGLGYMIGFDLGKSIRTYDDNLVFVGKENPFQTGKLKPIIWTKMENNPSLSNKNLKEIPFESDYYIFSTEKYDYFLQTRFRYHLIIIDKNLKSEIFNKFYNDPKQINVKGDEFEDIYQSHWTGELIKNKATVVFGFSYYNYGCPSLTVLDETEPEIPINCDNRH